MRQINFIVHMFIVRIFKHYVQQIENSATLSNKYVRGKSIKRYIQFPK